MYLHKFVFIALFAGLFFAACKSGGDKNQNLSNTPDPNAIYACPMHPEITGKTGDKCSKCGMALVQSDPKTDVQKFVMTFAVLPTSPATGQQVKMTFTPTIEGKPGQAVPLDALHEKKVHLILVSNDLSWFDHQHPDFNGVGFDLNYTFLKGGDYLLFTDYMPTGADQQVEKIPVTVSGAAAKPVSYAVTKTTSKVDDYEVTLTPAGGKWLTNNAMHITGTVKQGGKSLDVNAFENYLGAKAHVVMIGLAEKNFEHVHPGVEGSAFDLHTEFKIPGIYRVWLQFQTAGKVHTADFVIQVEEGRAGEMGQPESHEDEQGKKEDGHPGH